MIGGLKVAGIVGAGALMALGVSAFDSSVSSSSYSINEQIDSDTSEPIKTTNRPVPKATESNQASNCHPNYSGCLKINAGDYDCSSGSGNGPNYTGPVRVYESDPFDLDRDNDGWGCE
jgi:hypothetical protein